MSQAHLSEEGPMFEAILLPTDGSAGVKKAFDCTVDLATKCGSSVHVLFVAETVYPGPWFSYDVSKEAREKILEAGKDVVEKARDELQRRGVKRVDCLVREGHPAETILAYAKEAGIDLIVMGTRGRRGVERVLMGSVTREVVSLPAVPVLVVRAAQTDRKEPQRRFLEAA